MPESEIWVKVPKEQLTELRSQLQKERTHRADLETAFFATLETIKKFSGGSGKVSIMGLAQAAMKGQGEVKGMMDIYTQVHEKYYNQHEG